jgi:hypothetical protein
MLGDGGGIRRAGQLLDLGGIGEPEFLHCSNGNGLA